MEAKKVLNLKWYMYIHNFKAFGFCLQRKLKQNIQSWPIFTGWCTAQPGLNPSLTIIPPRRYTSSTARANNDAVLNSLERRHALKIKEFWNKYSTTKYCWGEAPWPLEGLIKNSTRRSLSKSAAAFHSLGIICSLPQFNQDSLPSVGRVRKCFSSSKLSP